MYISLYSNTLPFTYTYIYILLSFQLLHLSYSIYILTTLNINLANYTRFVEHSYFTKQAFVRGEVVDASFRVIPARSWSCWWDIRRPPQDEDSEEEEEESEPKEAQPQPTPLGDVPMLTYVPIQSAPGSSSDGAKFCSG